MNKVQIFGITYLVVSVVALYSFAVGRFKIFPYEYIEGYVENFEKFAVGDPLEGHTTVMDKLMNDAGLSFDRVLYVYPEVARTNAKSVSYKTLSTRPESPLIYIDPAHREGYRVIVGAFKLEDTFWGALLISPEGEIIHSWNLSTSHLKGNNAEDNFKNLYGVHVFPDGSIIFGMHQSGGGIVKVDACSKNVWDLDGFYHHAVSPGDDGTFWSLEGLKLLDQDLVQVSIETGEILKTIRMKDVRDANPFVHIWHLQPPGFSNLEMLNEQSDMSHANDVDPLSQDMAKHFPQFEPGDLAISYATTNLIFVLDPDSLQVKWWRVGMGDFQHDPDWEPNGRIVIFNNNLRAESLETPRKVSDIVSIDPRSMDFEIIHRGETLGFRSKANGRHQLTNFGTRMITSSQQGWAYEVDQDDRVVFSFVNNMNFKAHKALHLSEAWRLDANYFSSPFWKTCGH